MSEELWVVRAGEQAKYVSEFEANSYIAIGFHELASDDLSLTDEETVKGRVTSPAERTYAGQLVAFAYRMQVGDLVIVPRLTRPHPAYVRSTDVRARCGAGQGTRHRGTARSERANRGRW